MFLKSLELENVRVFKHLEIDFRADTGSDVVSSGIARKWTIILGENGLGKSTVLRAVALLTSGTRALEQLLDTPDHWIRNGASSCRMAAVLQTQEGEERKIELVIHRGDSVSKVILNAALGLDRLDSAIKHTDRNYFVAAYGATRRLGDSVSFSEVGSRFSDPRARSVATLFDRSTPLNPLESWAIDQDYQRGQEGIETIRSVLSSFLPGMQFSHIEKKAKQLIFKTPDGEVPLSQLSDGYQTVAAWIGDLLYQIYKIFEDYSDPLAIRGLLIIDEIDVHLHPIWQRELHEFLSRKLPNMQLLITTHSAVTAQQAKPSELHVLMRERNVVRLQRFDADPSSLLIGQLLISAAFGLETTDSRELESKKAEYRRLRDRPLRTDQQIARFGALSTELEAMLNGRDANGVVDEEMARLAKLQSRVRGESKS